MRAREWIEQQQSEWEHKGQLAIIGAQFELRLERLLTDTERTTLARLLASDEDQLLRTVLDPEIDLAAWLAAHSA